MANTEIKYTHNTQGCLGEVHIASEVVGAIAAMATSDIEGVASVGGNSAKDIRKLFGTSKLSKGVKVNIVDEVLTIDITLALDYGFPIPNTCEIIQKKIKTTVENMTGLTVGDVNTHIASVDMHSEE